MSSARVVLVTFAGPGGQVDAGVRFDATPSTLPAGALSRAQARAALGLVATIALPAGTILERSLLSPDGAVPGPAQALVGLALKAGQLPAGGLVLGELVGIVDVPTSTQGALPPPVALTTATVWAVTGPDSSGTTSASVVVPASLATSLAGDAARAEVALVAVAHAHKAGPASTPPTTKAAGP